MNELILVKQNGKGAKVLASDEAEAAVECLVEACDSVESVSNPEEQQAAVSIQSRADQFIRHVEAERKRVKEAPMELCRSIDAVAKRLTESVKESVTGLSRALGDYQALVRAKAAAEEQKRLKELAEIERQKASEIAKAESVEQVDAIRERFDAVAAQATPSLTPPPQADGQVVRVDWAVTVTDIWTLARAHPSCVKIEPRMSEIKSLLNAGVKVAGVSAVRETLSTTRRTGKEVIAV